MYLNVSTRHIYTHTYTHSLHTSTTQLHTSARHLYKHVCTTIVKLWKMHFYSRALCTAWECFFILLPLNYFYWFYFFNCFSPFVSCLLNVIWFYIQHFLASVVVLKCFKCEISNKTYLCVSARQIYVHKFMLYTHICFQCNHKLNHSITTDVPNHNFCVTLKTSSNSQS